MSQTVIGIAFGACVLFVLLDMARSVFEYLVSVEIEPPESRRDAVWTGIDVGITAAAFAFIRLFFRNATPPESESR